MAQGGDFLNHDGSYGESIYGGKFPDESPKLKHDLPGLLSMAIADRDSCGSLFTITFSANHNLDRKYVVFGKLVQGHDVLKKIENAGDEEGRPSLTVKIVNCGEFHNSENLEQNEASKMKREKQRKAYKERRIKRIKLPTESDSGSDLFDGIEPDPLNRIISAQESTGFNISNLNCDSSVNKSFDLHSNNISSSIASLISPQKGYSRTLYNQQSVHSQYSETLNNTLFLEKQGIKRELNSEDSGAKFRRTISGTDERSVCCKCVRSQCLKRYCECFAAGMFCATTCTCQGCHNLREYEDTVEEAREHVESRNPQAFALKEDEVHLIASSAMNKQVCNCKKSMCSKKYCECHKALVGCTDRCRCEGCKNMHGTKQEYLAKKRTGKAEAGAENLEAAYNEKLDMALTGVDFLQYSLFDPRNLTSSKLPFQYSYHEEDASKTQFQFRGFPAQDYSNLMTYNQYLIPPNNQTMLPGNSQIIHNTNHFQGHVNNDPGSQLYQLPNRFIPSDSLELMNLLILNQTDPFIVTKQNELVEDEIPEILKEVSAQQKGVKVNSPNTKRVAPPLTESGGLRNARKFVLEPVPLTAETTNYLQDYSNK